MRILYTRNVFIMMVIHMCCQLQTFFFVCSHSNPRQIFENRLGEGVFVCDKMLETEKKLCCFLLDTECGIDWKVITRSCVRIQGVVLILVYYCVK